MLFSFRYNKDGIAYGLIKFHDSFIKEIVKCFEKRSVVSRQTKGARKAVNKALKTARKKKQKPGAYINSAINAIRRTSDEIEYARKALKATYRNMENAFDQIEAEQVEEPIALIESARESFEKRNLKKGLELLQESKERLKKRPLLKTRTALFCGVSSEVGDLKREIERRKENGRPVGEDKTRKTQRNVLTGRIFSVK